MSFTVLALLVLISGSLALEGFENVADDTVCNVGTRDETDCYYSHEEINNYLDRLEMQYPDRVIVEQVGSSYEGREIKTITITNGDGKANKKNIIIDAGIHPREWIAPKVSIYVIKQLVEKYSRNKFLLRKHNWIVMPMVNPDGYEYTRADTANRLWRKTRKAYNDCFGVDLNRNFAYKFGYSGTSDDECSDNFKGPNAFSEPESVALRDVLKSYKGKTSFYLTLHANGAYQNETRTNGAFLLYPWAYDRIDVPNKSQLEDVAQTGAGAIRAYSRRKYTVGNSAKTIFPASGGSYDYAYSEGTKIAIIMEMPSAGETGFDPPPADINQYVKESWVGIVAMAKRVIDKY